MKILITGGSGFIGSNFIIYLSNARRSAKVFVVDKNINNNKEFRIRHRLNYRNFSCDITNKKSLSLVFDKVRPDVVLHLAAIHFIPYCNKNYSKVIDTNILGTYNVVQFCNKYNVKQLIIASSASVYGNVKRYSENNISLAPVDVYGFSKLSSELIVQRECKTPWTIFRFFNVFGPGETNKHLLETILEQLKSSDVIYLGNTKSKRDYIYVDDLCAAIALSILNPKAYSQVVNVGSGISYNANDIISLIRKLTGKKIKIKIKNSLYRDVDVPYMQSLIYKAKKILGWEPGISFESGLKKTLQEKNILQKNDNQNRK